MLILSLRHHPYCDLSSLSRRKDANSQPWCAMLAMPHKSIKKEGC